MAKKTKQDIKDMIAINRVGWEAIRHKDGWWVGTEEGVTCYGDHELARMALTIVWQRDGGKELNFSIQPYTEVTNKKLDTDYSPQYSAEEALKNYEKTGRTRRRIKP
ncbi:MAG: hypothetical protein ABFC56_06695 [Clostridiaceae bacterium]